MMRVVFANPTAKGLRMTCKGACSREATTTIRILKDDMVLSDVADFFDEAVGCVVLPSCATCSAVYQERLEKACAVDGCMGTYTQIVAGFKLCPMCAVMKNRPKKGIAKTMPRPAVTRPTQSKQEDLGNDDQQEAEDDEVFEIMIQVDKDSDGEGGPVYVRAYAEITVEPAKCTQVR